MRKIAVMNQKGGVGKTTTSVNIAAGLAMRGRRVCLIDLDPQAHASLHVGVEIVGDSPSIYHAFAGAAPMSRVKRLVAPNLFLLPASLDLAAVEVELADTQGREHILSECVAQMLETEPFDYIVMDCPPSLGVLTVNALTCAEEVLIPLEPHFFALHGLSKLLETTALVSRRLNRKLRVGGILLCMYETGTRLAADVSADLKAFLASSDPQAPWANAKLYNARIRRNIKLAESPSFGKPIYDYSPKCPGAVDYMALVDELIEQEGTLPLAMAG